MSAEAAESEFTPEQSARLAVIWDKLYALYLKQANGQNGPEVAAEIEELIRQRNEIRPWGWSTGRNWRDDQKPKQKA